MRKIKLFTLEKRLKLFLSVFIFVLTIGVSLGLYYVYNTTSFSSNKINERYGNSEKVIEEDFGIVENSAKSNSEILMTVHNHVIGFSIYFFLIGFIFYFNSIITEKLTILLMIEPLFSILFTFGSILGLKYYPFLIFFMIVSSTIMYIIFYLMAIIILYELIFKKWKMNYNFFYSDGSI